MGLKKYFFIIIFFSFEKTAGAQNFFENYTATDGFPATNIAAIIQDAQGFTWFGSSEGLTKFDGKNFIVYRHSDTDSSSLADNNINCLFIDSKGFLWIGTRAGLSRYNTIEDNFRNFHHTNKNSLSSGDVWSIGEDASGNIWAGTLDAGLNKISGNDRTGYSFTNYRYDSSNANSLSDNSVWAIHFDEKGLGWAGTSKGLNIFDPKAGSIHFQHFTNNASSSSIANDFVWRIYEDAEKNIWLTSIYGTLDCVMPKTNRQKPVFIHLKPLIEKQLGAPLNSVYDFCKDKNGNTWISVNTQVLFRSKIIINGSNIELKNARLFFNDPSSRSSLVNNMVWSIYCDKNNLTWCGTQKGVSVYDVYKGQFDALAFNQGKILPANKPVYSVYADENNTAWICTAEGLFISTRNTTKKILTGNDCAMAYNDANNGAFVATYHGLMYASTGEISAFQSGKINTINWQPAEKNYSQLPIFRRVNFLKKQGDELFAGGSGRLASIKLNTKESENFDWMKAAFKSDAQKIFRDVCLQKNLLWLGTDDGLFLFNRTKKKIIRIFDISGKPALISNRINCLYADEFDVYIGTSNGLNIYNLKTKQLLSFFVRDGLPDNNIKGITADGSNNLWLATGNGLSRFNPITKQVHSFSIANGLLANQLNHVSVSADKTFLFIGSDDGINTLNLTSSFKKPEAPKIAFTDFLIHGKSILTNNKTLSEKFRKQDNIQLNYLQNYFTVAFAALDFSNYNKNKYAYKLKGFDTGWVNSEVNSATYTNLKAGKYVFTVKSSNSYGVWNNEGSTLTITITPPWWQTNLFYTFCVLAAIFIIYAVYKIRLNRILAEQYMRNKIASDLHDDIGSSLSGISIYSELAKAKTPHENAELYRMLSSISDNTKITQQNMQDIVWSINPYNDSFEKIITRMKMFAAEILEPQNIQLLFEADDALNSFKLTSEKRKNLFLIFKEAVNNCAKYAAANLVSISIKKLENKIVLRIKDDGKGFNINEVKKGNGLNTMQTRAKELKGILSIDSDADEGTQVQLIFRTT